MPPHTLDPKDHDTFNTYEENEQFCQLYTLDAFYYDAARRPPTPKHERTPTPPALEPGGSIYEEGNVTAPLALSATKCKPTTRNHT